MTESTRSHPDLTSARWLPRSVYPRQLRLFYRLTERLQGVASELNVVEGAHHGFDVTHSNTEVSRAFRAAWVSALRSAISQPATSE